MDNGSGGLTNADNNNPITGQQAVVEANNTFQFKVRRLTLANTAPVFTATEIMGLAKGTQTMSAYTVAKVRQYDFISAGAPITPLTIGALPNAVFGSTGYGWTTTPLAYDRGPSANAGTTTESFHYASFSDNFQIQVVSGATYQVRVYLGDSQYKHDNVQVTFGNVTSAASYVRTTTPGATILTTFDETVTTVTATSSTLLINLQDLGGSDPNWVVDGLDIALTGSLPGAQPEKAADVIVGGTAPALTPAELAPVAAAAIQRLAATGLSVAQVAELRAATFVIQTNLSATTGALGLTALGSEVVTLDATGAGHGWFLDPTPADDNEFRQVVSASELDATNPAAKNHYDLLTVVMHELEHVLGVGDVSASVSPHTLMTDTLALGERRLPSGEAPVFVGLNTPEVLPDASALASVLGQTPSTPLFRVAPATTTAFVSGESVVSTAVLDNGRQTGKLRLAPARLLTDRRDTTDTLAGDRGNDPTNS